MSKGYRYFSELARVGVWMMHPQLFNDYQGIILNALANPHIETEWSEKRNPGSLLVFSAGNERPVETTVLDSDVFRTDLWPGFSKDDQVIHVLPITGPVTHGGAPCAFGTRDLADRFLYADNHENVVGHLVVLDTPGGDAMANDLDNVFKNAKKPVVGLIRGMNCSKGVWISSFIPHVFAEREDVEIGCVGAMWNIRGIRDGINRDNMVSYQVYDDQSDLKNEEFREAVQNDNLEPARKTVSELAERFRGVVKARWPNVPDEKLRGKIYRASDVIGEMVDGIKSFEECVNMIFELAGVERNTNGVVTPLAETTQPATGTEEPEQILNTNPQTIIPMKKELLEQIPGMGTVAVDEKGNVMLTEEQSGVLADHLTNGLVALTLVDAQKKQIDSLNRQVQEKEQSIQELAQATGKGIQQPAPSHDNQVEKEPAEVEGSIVSGRLANYKQDMATLKQVLASNGFMSN